MLPLLHGADVVLGHGGELNLIGQAKHGVHLVKQAHHVLQLVFQLRGGHEQVGVVLGEAPHPEQPVEGAGELVAVDQAQLAHTQGQIPVGVGLALVDHHAAGAVHGLDGEVLVIDDGGVHVVLVVVPVAGALPQLAAEDDRGGDLHIAVLLVDLAPVVDEQVFQHHALGQEEGEAGALVPQHEQAQLLAQLAVVPLFGLLQHLQVLLQHRLLGEGDAVHTGEHLVFGIAPPVGAGDGRQLYGLHHAGAHQVGAGAQVGEVPLLVKADVLALAGVLLDELLLIGLAGHQLLGLAGGQGKALQGQVLLDDFLHLGLDFGQVLGGEGLLHVKVVIEAVLNGGANGELGAGVQAHHGLGHDVGGGVPIGVLALGRVEGEDLQGAVLLDGGAQIADLPVNLGGAGGLVQAHADGLGHFRGGDALVELLDLAFQINLYHRVLLSAGANKKTCPSKALGQVSGSKKICQNPRFHPDSKGAGGACSASSFGPVTGPAAVPWAKRVRDGAQRWCPHPPPRRPLSAHGSRSLARAPRDMASFSPHFDLLFIIAPKAFFVKGGGQSFVKALVNKMLQIS